MTTHPLTGIHRSVNCLYSMVAPYNVGALCSYLEAHRTQYQYPRPGDRYKHRWSLMTSVNKIVVRPFPSQQIVVLGLSVTALDTLVDYCPIEVPR